MMNKKINVIGAGVIGLTTALMLQKKGYRVTIIAEHFPGDKSTHYTSPKAGARWQTLAPNSDLRLQRHDAVSFRSFWELAKHHAGEAGIMIVSALEYFESSPTEDDLNPWWKFVVPTFHLLDKSELPEYAAFGYHYTTVVINPTVYIKWLLKQFLNLGGRIERKRIDDLTQAMENVDSVVNCTGFQARDLVKDNSVVPVRGHNVLVKAPHIRKTMTMDRPDSYTYIIPRSDGTVILGTTKEHVDITDTKVSEDATRDILKRALECCPELSTKGIEGLQVLENIVGFRPTRKGGPRIQNEYHVSPLGKKTLVTHNYGHGGSGFQSSWGSCHEAVRLIIQGHSAMENDRFKTKKLLSRL